MTEAFLEHANVTVSDPRKTATELSNLFGWHVRWEGESKMGGYTIHVGGRESYLAIYTNSEGKAKNGGDTYGTVGGLNHLGIVVDDLDAAEARVRDAGYQPHNHGDYEPGRRFYFDNSDGIEIEVVSYD